MWQMANHEGFVVIWSWFGWSNQTLSVFTLWTITVYLVQQRKNYLIMLIPALFMTSVCTTYLLSEQLFHLDTTVTYFIAGVIMLFALVWFIVWKKKVNNNISK